MSLQVYLLDETLATKFADMWSLFCVNFYMLSQSGGRGKPGSTMVTNVIPGSVFGQRSMYSSSVMIKLALLLETFSTMLAFERLLSRMNKKMFV